MRLWAQRETSDMREDSSIALSYCWDPEKYTITRRCRVSSPYKPTYVLCSCGRAWRKNNRRLDRPAMYRPREPRRKSVSVGAMDAVYRCARWIVVALLDVDVHLAQQYFLREFIEDYEDRLHRREPSLFREMSCLTAILLYHT